MNEIKKIFKLLVAMFLFHEYSLMMHKLNIMSNHFNNETISDYCCY